MIEEHINSPSLDEVFEENDAWEKQIDGVLGASRLSPKDYKRLASMLHEYADVDSYLTSPMYYFFTGRYGLWLYEAAAGSVLFCWHPNKPGHILVFWPVAKNPVSIVRELFGLLPPPPKGLSLVRIKDETAVHAIERLQNPAHGRKIEFVVVPETVLDWQYPVRILSTRKVCLHKGNKYRNIQAALIHMRRHDVKKEKLDLSVHLKGILFLLHRWASFFSKTKEEYADLYETYDRLLGLAYDREAPVDGIVYFIDGVIEGISMWEVSGGVKKTANLFINICNTHIEGLSKFSIVAVCRFLSEHGIEYLNLGGSEFASLDFFKALFRPAISIDLATIDVKLSALSTENTSSEFLRRSIYA